MANLQKKRISKNKLQLSLLSLSLLTSGLNVMAVMLSKVSFTDLTNTYLAPLVVFFGFFQTVLVLINHLKL
jgi:uncharacterized membrane protein